MTAIAQNLPHNPVPKAKGLPVLGNMLEFGRDPLGLLHRAFQEHGDLVRFNIGHIAVYAISNPELTQQVMVERVKEFPKVERGRGSSAGLGLVGGNGLLTNSDFDSWMTQRRMMQPMFHRERLKAMGQKMVDATQAMLERWEGIDGPVDIDHEMLHVTMDIILRTMFSADANSAAADAADASTVALRFVSKRLAMPIKLPIKWPLPSHNSFTSAMKTLDDVIYKLIDDRMPEIGQYGDLLDMLLEVRDADTGEGMSREQLRDELVTVFLAGHETTAHSLAWTWLLLTKHPAVLEKIRFELDCVLQGRAPNAGDLHALTYTNQVFNEAMRLFPAAPIVLRRSDKSAQLQLNGQTFDIEPGAMLINVIRNIHRHPDFWNNPDDFDPERFDINQTEKRHRLAFMPFGAGSRMCIGNNLAQMEAVLILASVIQKFELSLEPNQTIEEEFAVTLRPKYGLQMRLKKR
jgi:cytochrome P450